MHNVQVLIAVVCRFEMRGLKCKPVIAGCEPVSALIGCMGCVCI